MRLAGKVAVITGAGTGIGQAIAIAFAEAGAAVVVDYVGKASVSEDTISKIKALGGKSLGVDADISIQNDVNGLIRKTVAAFGKLDIFVNNAGIEKKIPFKEDSICGLSARGMAKDLCREPHGAVSLFAIGRQTDDPARRRRANHQHFVSP